MSNAHTLPSRHPAQLMGIEHKRAEIIWKDTRTILGVTELTHQFVTGLVRKH
jgi:hypothetical protein